MTAKWYHIERCWMCLGRKFIETRQEPPCRTFDTIYLAEECPVCNGEGELRVYEK